MLDFWRNWTKSAEEKRQEALNAYLDGSLLPRQQAAFEAELAQDEALRAELAQLRLVRERLRQLPRRSAPRNFTLDPALYGRPQHERLVQAYPVLRAATVLTAFFFVLAVALQSLMPGGLLAPAAQLVEVTRVVTMTEEVAMEAAAEAPMEETAPLAAAPMVEGEVIEVTRVVMETVVETVVESAEEPAAAMSAEADEAAEGLMAPAAEPLGTAVPLTRTAPLPTPTLWPTPAPTQMPDIPRPPTEEAATSRAGDEVAAQNGVATAVPTPTATPEALSSGPLAEIPWLPVGFGALFVLLATLTFAARRRLL